MQCPLCNTRLVTEKDDEYFECNTCYGLVKNKRLYPDEKEELMVYSEHKNDVHDPGYQKFTSPITGYILANFEPHHKGLDFGSGPGPVISKVLKDFGYTIKQYDPYFADNPGLLADKYDYIAACEVIEHFYNPDKEYRRLKGMLKPGGQLICMTSLYHKGIEFNNWHYRRDPTHVFIYQKKTIEYIARNYGFDSFEISNDRRIIWK